MWLQRSSLSRPADAVELDAVEVAAFTGDATAAAVVRTARAQTAARIRDEFIKCVLLLGCAAGDAAHREFYDDRRQIATSAVVSRFSSGSASHDVRDG